MKLHTTALTLVIISALANYARPAADEGMFPISHIAEIDLRSQGLEIAPQEIYAIDKASLIYSIVRMGATGSFVSDDGLIITNHHVAFSAVQAASTKENDYLTAGFLARSRAEEIQAKGMTARIIESFRDVSADILSAIKPGMSASDRTKAIEKRIKEIVAYIEKENPGKQAEVSEMLVGKTYTLFLYTFLRDIRIVYVPPRSIGEFGGEIDNWMWPRHTGDFSFLRAYVAPDGSSADFSPQNVPFQPKRHLKINPAGVNEGDFVFLLGYPGRTYRHFTASYLEYEEQFRLPWVADWYSWQIDFMKKISENDPEVELRLASRINRLANTMKNYRGKLRGMKKLGLVEKKREEEKELQQFIQADVELYNRYGNVLANIDNVYAEMLVAAEVEMITDQLRSSVNLFNFAWTTYEASIELQKPDLERQSAYMVRNWIQTKEGLKLAFSNYHEHTDKAIFKALLLRALRSKHPYRIKAIDDLFQKDASEQSVEAYCVNAYATSKLTDQKTLLKLLGKPLEDIKAEKDPILGLVAALYPAYLEAREREKARKGTLDSLLLSLSEVKERYQGIDFIPDANGTLRLTYGRITGYQPADAVYYRPFTTLAGVLEKMTGKEPFSAPTKLLDLHDSKDFGRFAHAVLGDIPVCLLYNADTTSGNSGSPVLNARGELIGVNFDRTYEAIINDYTWNPDYSRSIAVDIRYVLWIIQKFAGADFLLKEMGIL